MPKIHISHSMFVCAVWEGEDAAGYFVSPEIFWCETTHFSVDVALRPSIFMYTYLCMRSCGMHMCVLAKKRHKTHFRNYIYDIKLYAHMHVNVYYTNCTYYNVRKKLEFRTTHLWMRHCTFSLWLFVYTYVRTHTIMPCSRI